MVQRKKLPVVDVERGKRAKQKLRAMKRRPIHELGKSLSDRIVQGYIYKGEPYGYYYVPDYSRIAKDHLANVNRLVPISTGVSRNPLEIFVRRNSILRRILTSPFRNSSLSEEVMKRAAINPVHISRLISVERIKRRRISDYVRYCESMIEKNNYSAVDPKRLLGLLAEHSSMAIDGIVPSERIKGIVNDVFKGKNDKSAEIAFQKLFLSPKGASVQLDIYEGMLRACYQKIKYGSIDYRAFAESYGFLDAFHLNPQAETKAQVDKLIEGAMAKYSKMPNKEAYEQILFEIFQLKGIRNSQTKDYSRVIRKFRTLVYAQQKPESEKKLEMNLIRLPGYAVDFNEASRRFNMRSYRIIRLMLMHYGLPIDTTSLSRLDQVRKFRAD